MPPRLNLFVATRSLAVRTRNPAFAPTFTSRLAICRNYAGASAADSDNPEIGQKNPAGPNMQSQEHVSEEAKKMAQMSGGEGPDLTQGTPVQDKLKEDPEAQKYAPQVMKDQLRTKASPPKPATRPFSTLARRQQSMDMDMQSTPESPVQSFLGLAPAEGASTELVEIEDDDPGHKFGLPDLPLDAKAHKDHRYDKVVEQITNLMMKDGKKSVAQRNMAFIMQHLRTAPVPTYNPARPLVPGAPPPSHLPLNPVLYLTLALDSVAPLLRIRAQRGAAGGGVALQIPVPLGLRQRRRQAFMWVLDAASKKKSRGSGRGMLAQRIAEELVAIVEGRSQIWERRTGIHKIATAARSNLNSGRRRR